MKKKARAPKLAPALFWCRRSLPGRNRTQLPAQARTVTALAFHPLGSLKFAGEIVVAGFHHFEIKLAECRTHHGPPPCISVPLLCGPRLHWRRTHRTCRGPLRETSEERINKTGEPQDGSPALGTVWVRMRPRSARGPASKSRDSRAPLRKAGSRRSEAKRTRSPVRSSAGNPRRTGTDLPGSGQ